MYTSVSIDKIDIPDNSVDLKKIGCIQVYLLTRYSGQ